MNVLAVDVGGTHVKVLVSGRTEARNFDSGPRLIPQEMVSRRKKDCWRLDLSGRVDRLPGTRAPQYAYLRTAQPRARLGGIQFRSGLRTAREVDQ